MGIGTSRKTLLKNLSLLLVLVAAVSSCTPKRIIPPPEPVMPVMQAIASMQAAQAEFSYYAARFTGSASLDGDTYSISGALRIRKDSAIFISITPVLGIEMARILITPDTVKMINRMESSYFVGDMRLINSLLNTDLDFYMLQALLTGRDFSHFTTDAFRLSEDRGMLLLHNAMRTRAGRASGGLSFEHFLWLDKNSYRISQTSLSERGAGRSIQTRYPSYISASGRYFPDQLQVVFADAASRADLSLRLSRFVIDQPQDFGFSIPARYRPMDM